MKTFHRFWQTVFWVALLLLTATPSMAKAKLPTEGTILPAMTLPAPLSSADAAYLGIERQPFRINQIPAQLIMIEIVGVYCPRCHEQAPRLNNLFKRLNRGKLKQRVKLLAIAAGASSLEVEAAQQQWHSAYPTVADEKFAIHKLLGEPRTPFTMLVDTHGRVVYTHKGVIKNVDQFYQQIKKHLP